MALEVTDQLSKLIDVNLSARTVTVRADAACSISKDPELADGGASAWALAANAPQVVDMLPGESLYAICANGQTANVSII